MFFHGYPGHIDDNIAWRKILSEWTFYQYFWGSLAITTALYGTSPIWMKLFQFENKTSSLENIEGSENPNTFFREQLEVAQRAKEQSPVQPESQPIDRQPLELAYRILRYWGAYQGEDDEKIGILHILRQTALDGDITIWGVEHGNQPPDQRLLLKIPPDHWVKYKIDVANSKDYKTVPTSPDSIPQKLYWHLHVDANEIRTKEWKNSMKRSNRWDWIDRS